MDIGTAKASAEERARVPHHGIDLVEPWEEYDSERFRRYVDDVRADAARRGKKLLLVGGTPLWLMALLFGYFEGPGADPELRRQLEAEEAAEPGVLHERLRQVDPESADRIHRRNIKRLVRALEVFETTGKPISELQTQFEGQAPRLPFVAARIDIDRELLKRRVAKRIDRMFVTGLVDEVRSILAAGGFGPTARHAIGYKEVLRFLEGGLDADELPYRIRSSTNRFVRRQHTWFRRMAGVRTLRVDELGLEERILALEASFAEQEPRS
jgi:tRNA dimethylallyltransferase